MCQFDICACAPVQSGREGPRVSLIVDRRFRPDMTVIGGKRRDDLDLMTTLIDDDEALLRARSAPRA